MCMAGDPVLRLEREHAPAAVATRPPPLLLFGSGIAFPESLDKHPKFVEHGRDGFFGEGPVGVLPMLARGLRIAQIVAETLGIDAPPEKGGR